MGMMTALELAESNMDIYSQVGIHLASNCYPPVPAEMLEPCVNAIDLVVIGDPQGEVKMPEGTTWRGMQYAPAEAIVENFRLWAWIGDYE